MKESHLPLAILLLSAVTSPAFAQSAWLGKWKAAERGNDGGIELTEFDGEIVMTGKISMIDGSTTYNFPRNLAAALVFSKDGKKFMFKDEKGLPYVVCERQAPAIIRCKDAITSKETILERI